MRRETHFKSDLLPFSSHLCSAQLTDSSRNSAFSNLETGAGASGSAIFVQQSAGSPEAMEAYFNYLAPQHD